MDDAVLRVQQEDDLKARHRIITPPHVSGTAGFVDYPSCREITRFPIGNGTRRDVRCLARRDNYVFAGVWGAGVAVIDLMDATRPRIIAIVDLPGELTSMVLDLNTLYVSDWTAGLHTIDVTEPSRPEFLTTHQALTHTQNRRVVVSGNTAVLVNEHAFSVFDVASPEQPRPLAYHHRLRTGVGWFRGAAFSSSMLLITQGATGVWAFDLSEPTQPTPICGLGLRLEGRGNDRIVADSVAVCGDRAFVGTSSGVWCLRLGPAGPETEVLFTGPGIIRETARGEVRDGRMYLCAFESHHHAHHIFDVAEGTRYCGHQRLSREIDKVWDFAFGERDTVAAAGTDGILVTTP